MEQATVYISVDYTRLEFASNEGVWWGIYGDYKVRGNFPSSTCCMETVLLLLLLLFYQISFVLLLIVQY